MNNDRKTERKKDIQNNIKKESETGRKNNRAQGQK